MAGVIAAARPRNSLLGTERGERVGKRIVSGDESLHAPHVLDLEVVSAMRRWFRQRRITDTRARAVLDDLGDLPLLRYPHDVLLPRIWALRPNAGAYDAAYLALAEALPAPLLTCDARVAGIPGHEATVEVI